MIRKIGILGISLLCLATIISCEKDFNEIGGQVVDNTKFETGELLIDVTINPVDITHVSADNIGTGTATVNQYLLGVYNNKDKNYKGITASIVSQLNLLTNPKTADTQTARKTGEIDSVFVLDKVLLKLPYIATNITSQNDAKPTFQLENVLGTTNTPTSLKVFRNETYLNSLDPKNPANQNSFQSDASYLTSDLLNENPAFSFIPNPMDTVFKITRHYSDGRTFKSDVKLANKAPFIAIPLDKKKMKTLFWDKFQNKEFSSNANFKNYFRGLVLEASGNDGALIPLNLLGTNASATLDFHYTITRFEKKEGQNDLIYKDTVPSTYSFALSGVSNSIYKMTPAQKETPKNNIAIQGTAGKMGQINTIDASKLNELRANNWLINDASLTFYVNQNIDSNIEEVPERLFLYQENASKKASQISDAYKDTNNFGGFLELSEDKKPEKYTFKITTYIAELLKATTTDIAPLFLKVYNNPTDNAIKNNALDIVVKDYNWNPRGVTLLDGNKTVNGAKRAVLKISYSKEK
ncbi:DUF4270 family protein [Tenacibaculum piscium]|uniref:DUF4270 family protein n=1 Tax=Tenacibaculum piscium TaxID=1458515 RepID=UPI001EFB9275|nr:DUF4270 family protein [Tenacibaculum piscium]MCG8183075.1 DUF4270 domain-containing protein [Tenacibaculum piscium]MCG8204741.1 DUF4270 domain-containing protein [Tenacibaculum piscium]